MNYIRRNNKGIEVSINGKLMYINKGIRWYLNDLCIKNLSTLDGRIDAVKKKYNIKHKVPIFVDSKCILFSTGSMRDFEVVYINYFEMIEYSSKDEKTIIYFKDGTNIDIKLSLKIVRKQVSKIQYILGEK